MKITLIPSDGVVGVDRVFRKVSMDGIDPTIHAVQFDTATSLGHIEYDSDARVRRENQEITDIAPFQVFIDRWSVAKPDPQTVPPDPVEAKRSAALRILDEIRLEQAALDPLAPQAVKDYAAVKPSAFIDGDLVGAPEEVTSS